MSAAVAAALSLVAPLALGACSSAPRETGDWPWYDSAAAIQEGSDAAVYVEVERVDPGEGDEAGINQCSATVIASDPKIAESELVIGVPASATGRRVEVKAGGQYVMFVNLFEDAKASVVSPGQGVFPVTEGEVGKSGEDTFTIADVATRLDLKQA
ncbi:MAG: hypothetical protein LBK95_06385 [Bifidobacteriaceae bacterium]|nr:hypothetical protein [Bifidobacteriaceae bacterium]